jgi:dihydroneopterin aldolase
LVRYDKIFLRQLALPAVIGVWEHERQSPQIIYFDIEASVEASRAAMADALESTVDYAAIYHYLQEYVPATRFQLLETLAENLSQHLMQKFSLSWLRLSISKTPADLPNLGAAGVIIERQAAPTICK